MLGSEFVRELTIAVYLAVNIRLLWWCISGR